MHSSNIKRVSKSSYLPIALLLALLFLVPLTNAAQNTTGLQPGIPNIFRLSPYNISSVIINGTNGGSMEAVSPYGTKIVVSVPPGTYISITNLSGGKNRILQSYNLTLETFTLNSTSTNSSGMDGFKYGFEIGLKGSINHPVTFINNSGGATGIRVTAYQNANWTSYTLSLSTLEGNSYVGGNYIKSPQHDTWTYSKSNGTLVDNGIMHLSIHVFSSNFSLIPSPTAASSTTPNSTAPVSSSPPSKTIYVLIGAVVAVVAISIIALLWRRRRKYSYDFGKSNKWSNSSSTGSGGQAGKAGQGGASGGSDLPPIR